MTTAATLRARAAECEQLADLAGEAPIAECLRELAQHYRTRAVRSEGPATDAQPPVAAPAR